MGGVRVIGVVHLKRIPIASSFSLSKMIVSDVCYSNRKPTKTLVGQQP